MLIRGVEAAGGRRLNVSRATFTHGSMLAQFTCFRKMPTPLSMRLPHLSFLLFSLSIFSAQFQFGSPPDVVEVRW